MNEPPVRLVLLEGVLAAIFVRSGDYVQAMRERRRMIAEMAPIYEKYDLLVTAAPGPASRFDAWRTIHFWQKPSLTTPFNVTGGPALVQCIGFTSDGLPLSMQLVGRPFEDGLVMRVAHAYEQATPWRKRRPALDPLSAFSTDLPPLPAPEKAAISERERDEVAGACRRAFRIQVPQPIDPLTNYRLHHGLVGARFR